jgi:hypothetical protein
MGELVSREIRRLRIRADCFRILARHAEDVVKRTHLLEMAEAEDRKIAEAELRNGARRRPLAQADGPFVRAGGAGQPREVNCPAPEFTSPEPTLAVHRLRTTMAANATCPLHAETSKDRAAVESRQSHGERVNHYEGLDLSPSRPPQKARLSR